MEPAPVFYDDDQDQRTQLVFHQFPVAVEFCVFPLHFGENPDSGSEQPVETRINIELLPRGSNKILQVSWVSTGKRRLRSTP